MNTPHQFFILGDLNTDFLKNPSTHLLDILLFNNLQQLVTSPTHITETSSTCIDLIITPSRDIVLNIDVLPSVCSKHSVPCLILKNHVTGEPSFKRSIYNYSKLNHDILTHAELLRTDWMNVIGTLISSFVYSHQGTECYRDVNLIL